MSVILSRNSDTQSTTFLSTSRKVLFLNITYTAGRNTIPAKGPSTLTDSSCHPVFLPSSMNSARVLSCPSNKVIIYQRAHLRYFTDHNEMIHSYLHVHHRMEPTDTQPQVRKQRPRSLPSTSCTGFHLSRERTIGWARVWHDGFKKNELCVFPCSSAEVAEDSIAFRGGPVVEYDTHHVHGGVFDWLGLKEVVR